MLKGAGIILIIIMVNLMITFNKLHISKIFGIGKISGKDSRVYQESFCLVQDTTESGSFCMDSNQIFVGGSNYLDENLCKGIEELIGNSSVADFGAGHGQYGRCLLRKVPSVTGLRSEEIKGFYEAILKRLKKIGVYGKPPVVHSWEGFDGGTKVEKFTDNFVKHIDLSQPFDLKKKFDWIMSLEVGEHIPQQYENAFMDNMIRHCKKGIIISWAIPNQPGKAHVNLRPNKYVIRKMKEKGLFQDVKSQEFLRRKAYFSYFKTNIMVFRKY